MSYPDKIVAKQENSDFEPHIEGSGFAATCVDVIDMGERINKKFGKLNHEVRLIFQTNEVNSQGRHFDISRTFTVSMNKKANLRIFLGQWRGKSYTEEQARKGVELHKLVGQHALISVEHRQSADGTKTYANISSIAPLPKEMSPPTLPAWERPEYIAELIARNAKEAEDFRRASAPQPTGFEDVPAALKDEEDTDGLPW